MKTKQKLILGFAVMIMAIIIFTGCVTKPPASPEFPVDFRGTWVMANSASDRTLTITENTYTLSHQPGYFVIVGRSENIYYIAWHDDLNHSGSETIVYRNGTLIISNCSGTDEDNCNGTWVRQ